MTKCVFRHTPFLATPTQSRRAFPACNLADCYWPYNHASHRAHSPYWSVPRSSLRTEECYHGRLSLCIQLLTCFYPQARAKKNHFERTPPAFSVVIHLYIMTFIMNIRGILCGVLWGFSPSFTRRRGQQLNAVATSWNSKG